MPAKKSSRSGRATDGGGAKQQDRVASGPTPARKPPRTPLSAPTSASTAPAPSSPSLPAPDTPSTSDLLLPSGRVNRAAIFRAAQRQAAPSRPAEPDADPDGDDDLALPLGPREGAEEVQVDAPTGPTPGGPPPPPQRVTFRLTRDLDKRLDKYLVDRISFMSRSKLQALIDAGGVLVNGKPAKASTSLRLHDTVEVFIAPPPAEDVPPEDLPLDVMYEDEHLVVINKSPDIIVHPARSHLKGTMINALAYHFGHRSLTGGDLSNVGRDLARPGVVHRLDRQTSGVIVFAKTDHAHWQLAHQFQSRSVDKRYVALCHGRVTPLVDVIDVPLGPHPSREKGYREKQVVRHDHLGKPAVSIFRVLAVYGGDARVAPASPLPRAPVGQASRLPLPSAPDPAPGWRTSTPRASRPPHLQPLPSEHAVSVVEVELKTGRTHQIRVHLAHLGFPLVGDDLYGGKVLTVGGVTLRRVGLHAALLTFRHPTTAQTMTFKAPFPRDLQEFTSAARQAAQARGDAAVLEPAEPPGATLRIGDLLRSEPRR